MESILTSIKKLLGITEEYEHFDADIIMHINSVFMILTQLGVGPPEGFRIESETTTWSDFLGDSTEYESVKTYMHHKFKLRFDPPASSTVTESMNRIISELEWRLNTIAETGSDITTPGGSSSETGVTDYTKLSNLPKINGETLIGNYNEKDPSVRTMPSSDVDSLWNKVFSD